MLFLSSSVNLCESIELADIYLDIVYFFLIIIYTFNSNIEICIVVETIQDIGAIELFTLSVYSTFVRKTLFSRTLHPDFAIISNKGSFLFLVLIIVYTISHFCFCQDTSS